MGRVVVSQNQRDAKPRGHLREIQEAVLWAVIDDGVDLIVLMILIPFLVLASREEIGIFQGI